MTNKDEHSTTMHIEDLGPDDPIAQKMDEHGIEYRRLSEEIELLKIEQKAHKEEMEELAKDRRLSRVKNLQGTGWQMVKVAGRKSKTIDPKLLLKNGVPAATIEKSTVVKEGSPYYMVKEA